MISCEFYKIYKNPHFIEHFLWLLLLLDVYCFQMIEDLFSKMIFLLLYSRELLSESGYGNLII